MTSRSDDASLHAGGSPSAAVPAPAPLEVLFLGGVFPRDEESRILARSLGPMQNAANALQWTLIRGLDEALGAPVRLLNAVFVGSYPRLHRDPWIHARRWSHAAGAEDTSVGFLNLFGVKHLWRIGALVRALRQWVASPAGGRRVVITYSMHMPFLVAAAMAKRLDPSLRVCVIVPDLPEHMNLTTELGVVMRTLKALDQRVLAWATRSVDAFVLLTKYMADPLGVGDRPWITMEGAVDPAEARPLVSDVPQEKEKVVLYTGTLAKAYGICDLLEAFALVRDPDCRLWICGAGDAEAEVRATAARDPRVSYLGQVTRAEVLSLQKRATVLVNPRSDAGEFTKYSFPSKLLEYLLSGTPAIVRRLPGVPAEYDDYFFVVEGPSAADLARTISDACSRSPEERLEHGRRAQRFVLEEKSGAVQARRIVELVLRTFRS